MDVVGHADRAGAAAIFAHVVMLEALELDVERLLELLDRALEHDAASSRFGAHDRQPYCFANALTLSTSSSDALKRWSNSSRDTGSPGASPDSIFAMT